MSMHDGKHRVETGPECFQIVALKLLQSCLVIETGKRMRKISDVVKDDGFFAGVLILKVRNIGRHVSRCSFDAWGTVGGRLI